MSIRLYVGNLPKTDVEREDLQAVFVEVGELISVKTIKDRKTGKCRGFGFVTVETEEQADRIIELYHGTMFQDLALSIEKALPKAKGQDEDDDGDSSEPKPAKEPSTVPKPTLSINKVASTTETPRRSSGGGGKKGGRKESNKGNTSTNTNAPTTTTESFQPDPRWAGKLAELKDKLAQSGNA